MQTILAQLRYPLIQAPMAGVQDAALAIAVCQQGGLGSLPAAMLSHEQPDARAEHTALTNVFSGGLARGIVNTFMQEAGCIHPAAPPFPFAGAAIGALRKAAEEMGNHGFSPFWAGQNASLARAGNAAQIIARLFPGESAEQ